MDSEVAGAGRPTSTALQQVPRITPTGRAGLQGLHQDRTDRSAAQLSHTAPAPHTGHTAQHSAAQVAVTAALACSPAHMCGVRVESPPSTARTWPVMKLESGQTRNAMAAATSCAWAMRLRGRVHSAARHSTAQKTAARRVKQVRGERGQVA